MKQLAVISHGKGEISDSIFNILKDNNYIAIHVNTEKNQPDKFKDNLQIDDVVILYRSNELYGIGKIISNSQIGTGLGLSENWIIRNYEPISMLENPIVLDIRYDDGSCIRKHWSPHANRTFFITNSKDCKEIEEKILSHLNVTIESIGLDSLVIDLVEVENKKIKMNVSTLNQILYGPPGTGKTYKIQQIAKDYIDVEFNKEFYLEDLVKNISWLDVVIYAVLDIGKPCKLADILKNRFHTAKWSKKSLDNAAHIDQVLVTRSIQNPTNLNRNENVYPRREPLIFDRNFNNEWFIVESEKTKIEDQLQDYQNIIDQLNNPTQLNDIESQKRYEIVTFHQSFSYEDFVEGIRASTNENGQIQYSIEDGIFKRICDKARKEPNKKFAIFIDEINRGNIANIFGELITLIEPDKRQGCENELSITLPYSKELFSVPNNLDIYGTMNTSDHSLTKLDLALRRRFKFVELLPNYKLLEEIKVYGVNIGKMLKTMNERIEILLGRDYLIGHSYFLELQDLAEDKQQEKLASIFQHKIIPLLQEYFFEDWERIQWVLNDQNKEQAYQFIHLLSETRKNDLSRLFGNVQNMNQVPDRRYQINEDAFKQAEAYSQILAE